MPRGENWKQEWVLDEFVRCKSNSFTCLLSVMPVLYSTCIFKSLDRCFSGSEGVQICIKESESQNYNTTLWNQIFVRKGAELQVKKHTRKKKSFSNLNCFSCFSGVSEKVTASDEMYCKYGSNQAQDPRFTA